MVAMIDRKKLDEYVNRIDKKERELLVEIAEITKEIGISMGLGFEETRTLAYKIIVMAASNMLRLWVEAENDALRKTIDEARLEEDGSDE